MLLCVATSHWQGFIQWGGGGGGGGGEQGKPSPLHIDFKLHKEIT